MRGTAILAALPAALIEQAEQAAFRLYMSDSLFYMGDNKRLTQRYADIVSFSRRNEETRTGQEIADDITTRLAVAMKKGATK